MTKTAAPQAHRHQCLSNASEHHCSKGEGKGPAKCRYCGGRILIRTGTWGVFVWRGDGRYPLAAAVRTFGRLSAAENYVRRSGNESLVERFVTA